MASNTVQLAEGGQQQQCDEQREGLLWSLANNPYMLDDFWQFVEFKRNQSGPTIPQQKNLQSQKHLSSVNQPSSSTPKRGRPLNDSSGSTGAVVVYNWRPIAREISAHPIFQMTAGLSEHLNH